MGQEGIVVTLDPSVEPIDSWPDADIILPEQLYSEVSAVKEPERRLRLAILKDALRYFQRFHDTTDHRERALFEDAADWFASPDRSEPFAFENVCDALGLDPDYVRRGLRRWREAARSLLQRPRPVPLTGGTRQKTGCSHRRAA